jgi:hypothetical protein
MGDVIYCMAVADSLALGSPFKFKAVVVFERVVQLGYGRDRVYPGAVGDAVDVDEFSESDAFGGARRCS